MTVSGFRPFGRHEGLPAHRAQVARFLRAMDTDVAFAGLPSCRAVQIWAKYVLGVHCGNLRLSVVVPLALRSMEDGQ